MTNIVVLHGRLSRPVEERVLPSGDRLAVLDLTVPGPPPTAARAPAAGSRAESVPLAWFSAPAWVAALGPGADLVVLGRVRRRYYRAGPQVQSRTEVVVEAAAPPRSRARLAALVARATGGLAALGEPPEAPEPPVPRPRRRRAAATF